jgi:hypothetical protein
MVLQGRVELVELTHAAKLQLGSSSKIQLDIVNRACRTGSAFDRCQLGI